MLLEGTSIDAVGDVSICQDGTALAQRVQAHTYISVLLPGMRPKEPYRQSFTASDMSNQPYHELLG